MAIDIEEIYQRTISPLPKKEQLKIASLILEEVTRDDESLRPERTGSVRELFGSANLGRATGANNESIDADLTREYTNTHGD